MIYASIPAAGKGTRLQPLAFSKELALIGEKTVIEYTLERLVLAGVTRIFITINSDKLDIPRYLSDKTKYGQYISYVVKDSHSLPESIFAPVKFIKPDDHLVFGLPDTIWYPKDCYKTLVDNIKGDLTLGLFDSGSPEKFDSVVTDSKGQIQQIDVKTHNPKTKWTWGIGAINKSAIKLIDSYLKEQDQAEPIFGVAANQYCQQKPCYAIKFPNSSYLDIGRKEDYQNATKFIKEHHE